MVITDILPQAVSRKTPIEVQFLTKVLKVNFGKSLGLSLGSIVDDLKNFLRQF